MNSKIDGLTPKARRTRSAILTSAGTLIGRDGVKGVSVLSVCSEAGIGRTSFYNYFRDVDALISAVALEAATGIKDRFDRLHTDQPRGRDRLKACFEMILTLATEDRETMLLLTSLAQMTPEIEQTLNAEIVAELSANAHTSPEETALLGQFLSISTIAFSRHLAEGKLHEDSVQQLLEFLMRSSA